MRNNQNNNKRMRGRNNGGGGNHNNNNRRSQNPMTRVYESNGPDIKIRGTASHVAEKYVQLARDARTSGDPVAAENYYQHAEHYFRLIAAAQEQFRQNQPQQQPRPDSESNEEGGDDNEAFSHFGAEPGFVQQPQQQQPQPQFQPREHQPYPREQNQPREFRDNNYRDNRDNRPQQNQPQPMAQQAESDNVERLPSFITGGATQNPQASNGAGFEGGSSQDRFNHRRRRRPHNGPRPEGQAPAPQGEDFNSSE